MTKVKILKLIAEDNNHTLLSDGPIDKKYRYLFRCNLHNEEFKMTMTHFKERKKGCPKCRKKSTKEDIYNRCVKKCDDNNLELIKYSPKLKDNLLLRCHCGKEWEVMHDNFIRKHTCCPDCSRSSLKGLYSDKYFEKYPEEKQAEAWLYFIYLQDADKYKVGITVDLNNRLRKLPNNTVVKLYKHTLYTVYQVEQAVLNKFRKETKIYFQGHTECLSNDISEIIEFANVKLGEFGGTLLETIPSQATE